VRERGAKAAVRDRSVAIGSATNQCRRPDVNAPKRVSAAQLVQQGTGGRRGRDLSGPYRALTLREGADDAVVVADGAADPRERAPHDWPDPDRLIQVA
jgi:hypothetical protein